MYRNITVPLTNCYHFSSVPDNFLKVLSSRNLKEVVSSVIEINNLLMLAMLSAEAILFYRIWADNLVLFQTLPFSQPFNFMPCVFFRVPTTWTCWWPAMMMRVAQNSTTWTTWLHCPNCLSLSTATGPSSLSVSWTDITKTVSGRNLMLWHGNDFCITNPLWGESIIHWWIPFKRGK